MQLRTFEFSIVPNFSVFLKTTTIGYIYQQNFYKFLTHEIKNLLFSAQMAEKIERLPLKRCTPGLISIRVKQ